MPDPQSTVYAVASGLSLYFLIERPKLLGKHNPEDEVIFADGEEEAQGEAARAAAQSAKSRSETV